ncbi:MAG: class I SAM-dependent methyltransferase [Spirochaetia bacterium]|nr:class I SAM-dependent methyltransferase [Spirochaetia bacterium]
MPTMQEIYKKYAEEYDNLVKAEDYQRILIEQLVNNIDWNKKIVYEAGIGTGRLTKIYIDKIEKVYGFDKEDHMLSKCEENLNKYKDRMILQVGDNESLPVIREKAHIFIEGWSFGHTIVENSNNIKRTTEKLIKNINENIINGGEIIIIETMGTNVNEPKINTNALKYFYNLLENKYGFENTIVSTDFKFKNYEEAAETIGFFFGAEMGKNILKNKKKIVPEYTGIWRKNSKK